MADGSCPLSPGPRGRLLLMVAAVLAVAVPFLFWNQTWFGRELSNEEMTRYLRDDKHPRKIQHALSQMSARIASGDPTAGVWFPDVVALSRHPVTEIRTTAAWLMGQDNRSEPFHRALLALLRDPELIVRRNAALALVRFGDSSGRGELIRILEPYGIHAPESGRIRVRLEVGQHVGANALLARVRGRSGPADGSPRAGGGQGVEPVGSRRGAGRTGGPGADIGAGTGRRLGGAARPLPGGATGRCRYSGAVLARLRGYARQHQPAGHPDRSGYTYAFGTEPHSLTGRSGSAGSG